MHRVNPRARTERCHACSGSPPCEVLLLHHSIYRSSQRTANLPCNRTPQRHVRAWSWHPDAYSLVGRLLPHAAFLAALLGSRPLSVSAKSPIWGPCCCTVAKYLQIAIFFRDHFAPVFRRFSRVDARLLHRCCGLHPHSVRDDRYSTSRLEPPHASFVLGAFPAASSRCRRPQRTKRVRARIAYPSARNVQVTVKISRLCYAPSTYRGYDLLVSNGTEVSIYLPPPHQRDM